MRTDRPAFQAFHAPRAILTACCLCLLAGHASSAPADSAKPNLEDLESRVRSTLLFGGSSPVSFSGEARLKVQDHYFSEHPAFISADRAWTQANYEGNESILRLGMVVRPNRNAVLWSKIGFQHTLPGNYINGLLPGSDGFRRAQERHDKSENVANIHEDMAAGLAIRTVPASFWLKMGNVLWTEASPLTIWKAQPRTFAWEYLPYEVEQPVARYYEYNVAKGEKTGRAAWNKKPFNGVEFRSIHLPGHMQVGLTYATFERYDNFEREYIDFSGDLAYSGDDSEAKGRGIGDSHRHMIHARIAREKLYKDLTLGYSGVGIFYRPDVALTQGYRTIFGFPFLKFGTDPAGNRFQYAEGRGFHKEPQIHSVDLRGSLGERWEIHGDLAFSQVDTIWTTLGVDSVEVPGMATKPVVPSRARDTTHSSWVPAFFSKVRYKAPISVQADVAVIPKGFYSPFSFVAPMDAFFPFGSNMVGGGKFVARGEGSPYIQNMAGMQLTASIDPGYGHFRVTYGQHFQLKQARDVLFFPHRLNGQDLSTVFHSSYNRWGNGLIDHSIDKKYNKRIGDESYSTTEFGSPLGPDAGGLRTDYLSAYEGFVPYENLAQAESSVVATSTIFTRSRWIPEHRKWTFNLEIDGAWDFGPLIGYPREFLLGAYAAVNGVSKDFRTLSFGPSGMMLWGGYFRVEPAIAITDKLFLLALGGYETWRSDMAYMDDPATQITSRVPLAYHDLAAGIGFDWEFASRVGLHGRLKWMRHTDAEYSDNDWTNRLGSAEIKMWF